LSVTDYVQPWGVMQEIDRLLMKTIPWPERLEQIGYSLLRMLQSDAAWLLTAPSISGIGCGIVRSPIVRDPNACVILTDLAPPDIFSGTDSPLAQVLREGVPRTTDSLNLANDRLDNDLVDTLLRILDVHPSLIVPLQVGCEPIGVLVVGYRDGSSDQLPTEILQAMGEHLGVMLQSAYLRDASRHQSEALATLNRIALTITSSLDIEEVIQRTMAGINEILDVEAGSLLLIDERTNELYFKITLRGENKSVTAFRLQAGQGIAGWVVAHNTQAIVNDASADPRFYSKIDEAIGFKTKSVLCAPLVVQGRPIGALEVINKRQGYFTPDDQELLTSMCASLAIALHNAGLYKEARGRAQRTAVINDITAAINTSLSLLDAGQAIISRLRKLLAFDYASVCLLDNSAHNLQVYNLTQPVARGSQAPVTIPFDGSGLEWIVQFKGARLIDLREGDEPGLDAGIVVSRDACQVLSVPLVVRELVRGVINLANAQPRIYTPADLEILEQMAPQLAGVIEKARLFDLMERRTAELQTLNRMVERLVSSTDTERILSIALAFMPHLVPSDLHALLLLDEDGGHCGINLSFTADEMFLDQVVEDLTTTLTSLIESQPLRSIQRQITADQRPMPADWAPVATLTLPILTRRGPLGVAHLASHKAEDFAGDTLRVFSLVVSHIAAALENGRLFREVEEERARLEAFLSSTTNLIVAVDRTGRVVLANPAAREAFGQGKDWENRPLSEIVQNEALLDLFSEATHHHAVFGEVPLPNGRTLYASLSPIPGGDEEKSSGWVAAMQDITDLKELDQMKTDFINAVSHDLRSPLSGILISTHLVSQYGEINEEQQKFMTTIEQRVAAIAELIDDLIDVGRIQAGVGMEMEPCTIAPIIAQVVKQFGEQIDDKRLKVEIKAGTNLPPVMGNARRLGQVLSNLISNAIKYTPEEGRVTIEGSFSHGEIVVHVHDTGIGIPLADQPRIFDKFYRVERPETTHIKGTGLGLAITRSIVEKHGGHIWVESELNAGSTFTFTLPIITEEIEAEVPPQTDARQPQ
jgi:PAS domain S-box-containing protein